MVAEAYIMGGERESARGAQVADRRSAFRSPAAGNENRSQSEVIGAILMTAIAVVLAAVISQYVFGINIIQSPEQSVGPQISFDTTVESDGNLTIRHQSGDRVDTTELNVTGSETGDFGVEWGNTVRDEWTASESITLGADEDSDESPTDSETIRIIWESSTTDDSAVLLKYEYDP
jgi:flagellin-like protein